MTIITGGSIASYRSFANRQKIKLAAEDFAAALRTIKKNVDSGESHVLCQSPLTFKGNVISKWGNSGVNIEAMCSDNSTKIITVINPTYSLTNNAIFTNSGNGGWGSGPTHRLIFEVLSRQVTLPATPILIADSPGNEAKYRYKVEITSAGSITIVKDR